MTDIDSPERATSGRWLSRPGASLVAIALAVVVAARSLSLGFVTDDYAFRALLHVRAPAAPAKWDLFRFAAGDAASHEHAVAVGLLPWWSASDLKIHFLRPVTSLLFAFDDAVFGDHAIGYHIHSIAWFVALLFVARAFFRRVLEADARALALLVFGFAHANASGYAWASARHVVIGATFGLGGVVLHLHAREIRLDGGSRRALALEAAALVALALGLGASESALGAIALTLAVDVAGVGFDVPTSLARRVRPALPAIALGVAYVALYRALGGGAFAGGGYHDPIAEPAAYGAVAAPRVVELLGDALGAIPVETAFVWPASCCVALGLGATAVVALAVSLVWRRLGDRDRRALILAMLAAPPLLFIGATGFPSARVLVLPNAVLSIFVAIAIRPLFLQRSGVDRSRAVVVVAGVVLGIAHLVLAPLSSLRDVRKLAERARATEAIAATIRADAGDMRRVVIVAASDPYVFMYPHGVLAEEEPNQPRCWSVLSAARSGHVVRRVDETTLRVTMTDRPIADGGFDALFRASSRPFSEGETMRQCGLDIRVVATTRGKPSTIEVRFERPLEIVARSLFVFQDGALVPFEPPAIGQELAIPWSAGPAGPI